MSYGTKINLSYTDSFEVLIQDPKGGYFSHTVTYKQDGICNGVRSINGKGYELSDKSFMIDLAVAELGVDRSKCKIDFYSGGVMVSI